MKRSTTLALGAVLAATLFAGCGSDSKSASSDAAYCERIKAYKAKADEPGIVDMSQEEPWKSLRKAEG